MTEIESEDEAIARLRNEEEGREDAYERLQREREYEDRDFRGQAS